MDRERHYDCYRNCPLGKEVRSFSLPEEDQFRLIGLLNRKARLGNCTGAHAEAPNFCPNSELQGDAATLLLSVAGQIADSRKAYRAALSNVEEKEEIIRFLCYITSYVSVLKCPDYLQPKRSNIQQLRPY